MKKTWILLADRTGAKILEQESFGSLPAVVKEIPHPDGALKNQDLVSDKPGRHFSASPGATRHTASCSVEPRDHVLERFSKQLAEELHHAASARKYEQLILIAEPQVLGQIRGSLSKQVGRCVIGSVDKDLMHLRVEELKGYISDVIRP